MLEKQTKLSGSEKNFEKKFLKKQLLRIVYKNSFYIQSIQRINDYHHKIKIS